MPRFAQRLLLVMACLAAVAACAQSTSPLPRPPAPTVPALAPATKAPAATEAATHAARPSPTRLAAPATRAPTLAPTLIPTNTIVERGALAPGFSLLVYAQVPQPTSLAFGPDGRLYVASAVGAVYALADLDGDQRAEARETFAAGLTLPLGLAWVGDRLYISYRGSVAAVADANGDGQGDGLQPIARGLPAFGLHQNDGLALGPDGYIYLGMGSTCDHCQEVDPRSGTILRFKPDGSELKVFANGFRNPYDLAFNAAGDLFATDNSRDDLGPAEPPEELNHVRAAQHYGWPECWAGSLERLCTQRTGPVATFTAHTSANGLTFYSGRLFPPEYWDNAFVAVLGSIYMFPEDPERGVARVRLAPTGNTYTGSTEWLLQLPTGRPVDVITGPDGGLYVADYENGEVLRIVWGPGP